MRDAPGVTPSMRATSLGSTFGTVSIPAFTATTMLRPPCRGSLSKVDSGNGSPCIARCSISSSSQSAAFSQAPNNRSDV
jgi:hypothetical protein